MNHSDRKNEHELIIFGSFIQRMGLRADSVRHGEEQKNEPDILCRLESVGEVAFELTEVCAPEFSEAEAGASKAEDGVAFAWGNDVADQTIRKKLQKTYVASGPIDLLLYTNGRTALPDEAIKAKIETTARKWIGPVPAHLVHGRRNQCVFGP